MTEAACGVSVGVTGVFHHSQLLWRPPTPKSVYASVFTYVCVFVSGDVGDSMWWFMTIWQLSCVLCVWVWENEADCRCLLSVFWCRASVPRARCLELTFFDLHRNKWWALDASDVNGDRPNSTSCPSQPGVALTLWTCQAVHGKWHATDATVTQLTILFLTVILIRATRSVAAWSSLPESVLLPFTHNFVSFSKSKPWKVRNKWGDVSQRRAWCCLHTVTPWHVPTGGHRS